MFKVKTHPEIALDKLMRMAGDLDDIADAGSVRAEAIDELSDDLGIAREKLYAALALSQAELTLEHQVQFVVCTGGCQGYGALECVRELLDIREDRLESEDPSFDVVPRPCLNRCQDAPVVELRSPGGSAVLG